MMFRSLFQRRCCSIYSSWRFIYSKPVSGSEDIARVGTISASDEIIGRLIADAMDKVTSDGVITVEESKSAETSSEVVEGMQFDRGYVSPYMSTSVLRLRCDRKKRKDSGRETEPRSRDISSP